VFGARKDRKYLIPKGLGGENALDKGFRKSYHAMQENVHGHRSEVMPNL